MFRRAVCIICTLLCALAAALCPFIAASLPVPPEDLTSLPYEGWSGVVRVWVYQGFRSGTGSVVPWLNSCLTRFEKRNSGVYVQIETVSAVTLAGFTGVAPRPDMIIFTPGALDSYAELAQLDMPQGIEAELAGACADNAGIAVYHAVPLCRGGYGLLLNTGALAQVPDDWQSAIEQNYSAPARRTAAHYALQIPGEGGWPRAAEKLLGMLPQKSAFLPDDYLSCSMIKAWSDFKKGNVYCIPASQWHLRQLELLEADGKAPQWQFMPIESGWSDQYFAAGIVESGMADYARRADVCRRIIAHLTSAESQGTLDRALLFPALAGIQLYNSAPEMEKLAEAYSAGTQFVDLFG